jgi:hypothetical protein
MLCKMMVVSGRRYASQSPLAPTQTYAIWSAEKLRDGITKYIT